jgi:hypothetical protein
MTRNGEIKPYLERDTRAASPTRSLEQKIKSESRSDNTAVYYELNWFTSRQYRLWAEKIDPKIIVECTREDDCTQWFIALSTIRRNLDEYGAKFRQHNAYRGNRQWDMYAPTAICFKNETQFNPVLSKGTNGDSWIKNIEGEDGRLERHTLTGDRSHSLLWEFGQTTRSSQPTLKANKCSVMLQDWDSELSQWNRSEDQGKVAWFRHLSQ